MALDLTKLNKEQRCAVENTEGPLLVLAGAGSGKTRVLTYRIAHILELNLCAPWQVLAITFTNKAANEMRERLDGLLGSYARGMWIFTFHALCARILRQDADLLGFTKSFTIYDDSAQKRLIKDLYDELRVDSRTFPINAIRGKISQAKNELLTPGQMEAEASDPLSRLAARFYALYQRRLKDANAFDFDDLLFHTFYLFKNNPTVREAYRNRFRYILVDEYQDTNHAQYMICRMLVNEDKNFMVVGDDDQSIYSWRGADIANILEFEKDYPDCKVFRLEQNYRSVANILNAANGVIAHNQHRKEKALYTDNESGEKIHIYLASDERDEGRWIASQIEARHRKGLRYDDIAVFYRTNAQSRSLEDMLLRAGVPYRIVGGTRFFERREIQDVMAYLTLIINPADDIAATRVINVPKRGIGRTTIDYIQRVAFENNTSFLNAARAVLDDTNIRLSTRKEIAKFINLLDECSQLKGDLRKLIEIVVERSGLIRALEAENSDEALGRIENIQEFYGVVDEFVSTHNTSEVFYTAPTEVLSQSNLEVEGEAANNETEPVPVRVLSGESLQDFIEWVTLRTELDATSDSDSAITMMTVHSSKGLEFDCVFVAGMEETIFPHSNAFRAANSVEEERRLAYVAITRARKYLYLTCASHRSLFGSSQTNPASRFLSEIPDDLKETTGVGSAGFSGTGWEKRGSRRGISGSGVEAGRGAVFGKSSTSGNRSSTNLKQDAHSFVPTNTARGLVFKPGDTVEHKMFGRGVVKKIDGDILHVKFAKYREPKKLLRDFAPLVKVDS